MYTAAPRLDPRLLRLIAELDDPSNPMAETYRQARETAAQLGIPRPSYERVRIHLKVSRASRAAARKRREILMDVAMYRRPVEDLYELLE